MPAFCVSFVRVEVDVEIGHVAILEHLGVADCGTVIHPQSLGTQISGGAVQGFGLALGERHIFDPQLGLSGTRGLYTSKIPTYLDVPLEMHWDAVNEPDPYSPIGSKGIGEPRWAPRQQVICAISDALGGCILPHPGDRGHDSERPGGPTQSCPSRSMCKEVTAMATVRDTMPAFELSSRRASMTPSPCWTAMGKMVGTGRRHGQPRLVQRPRQTAQSGG